MYLRKEAKGLKELKKSGAIRVPEVLYVDLDCLLLEQIHIGEQTRLISFQILVVNWPDCISMVLSVLVFLKTIILGIRLN